MKLPKAFTIVVCAGVLSMSLLGSAHQACAQDEGGWGAAPESDSSDVATSPDTNPPLDVSGDWCGTLKDKHDGSGDATFFFDQSGTALLGGSDFDFEWPDSAFAFGPLTGTVSSKGIKFTGSAGTGCSISGSATKHGSILKGHVTFHKKCAKFFGAGPLSISPCM